MSAALPTTLYQGLVSQDVPSSVAHHIANLPPVSTLFAAFLGYNPMQHLLGASVIAHLPASRAALLQGHSFFPHLISGPFRKGLHIAFDFSIAVCLIAAAASWSRGARYVHNDQPLAEREGIEDLEVALSE